jgi:hypothetical protein
MVERFAALAHLHPLRIDDMAPSEMLACHLLPEDMRPAGFQPRPRSGANTKHDARLNLRSTSCGKMWSPPAGSANTAQRLDFGSPGARHVRSFVALQPP